VSIVKHKIWVFFIIVAILALVPMIQYYAVPFHPLQEGSRVLSTDTELQYQLGYSRTNQLYLLIWTKQGDFSMDLCTIRSGSHSVVYTVNTDIHFTSRGLRIYIPSVNCDLKCP